MSRPKVASAFLWFEERRIKNEDMGKKREKGTFISVTFVFVHFFWNKNKSSFLSLSLLSEMVNGVFSESSSSTTSSPLRDQKKQRIDRRL